MCVCDIFRQLSVHVPVQQPRPVVGQEVAMQAVAMIAPVMKLMTAHVHS